MRRARARKLLKKICQWCRQQHQEGRLFLIENPITSRLWQEADIQSLLKLDGVMTTTCHSGAYGATNSRGQRFMGNCPHILHRLTKKLTPEQLHQCVPIEGRETRLSQVYPYEMVTEAHHKIGLIERHNHTYRTIMERIIDYHGITGRDQMQVVTAMTAYAKNSCTWSTGRPPFVAAFGRIPRQGINLLSDAHGLVTGHTQAQAQQFADSIRAEAQQQIAAMAVDSTFRRALLKNTAPDSGYIPDRIHRGLLAVDRQERPQKGWLQTMTRSSNSGRHLRTCRRTRSKTNPYQNHRKTQSSLWDKIHLSQHWIYALILTFYSTSHSATACSSSTTTSSRSTAGRRGSTNRPIPASTSGGISSERELTDIPTDSHPHRPEPLWEDT